MMYYFLFCMKKNRTSKETTQHITSFFFRFVFLPKPGEKKLGIFCTIAFDLKEEEEEEEDSRKSGCGCFPSDRILQESRTLLKMEEPSYIKRKSSKKASLHPEFWIHLKKKKKIPHSEMLMLFRGVFLCAIGMSFSPHKSHRFHGDA